MALLSSAISQGDEATSDQYNNLRTDAITHTHDGVITPQLAAGSVGTTQLAAVSVDSTKVADDLAYWLDWLGL